LLSEIASRYGSQCAVAAIDAARRADGEGWEVVVHSGKERTGRNAVAWAREAVERGAGEILLTSWDRDGTRSGYDTALLAAVSEAVRVPVVASGGAALPEHLVEALKAGADWDVQFLPFSLSQNKVEEGETSVWDEPEKDSGLLAMQLGIAVRDTQAERFLDAHLALFAIRHDLGKSQRDEALLRTALAEAGVDVDAAFAEVASGVPLKKVREEHERGVSEHQVWGVPTFIVGDQAAFVRVMDRPRDERHDPALVIERIVGLLSGWPDLNEFKHTSLSR
jgi:hypothetical protein